MLLHFQLAPTLQTALSVFIFKVRFRENGCLLLSFPHLNAQSPFIFGFLAGEYPQSSRYLASIIPVSRNVNVNFSTVRFNFSTVNCQFVTVRFNFLTVRFNFLTASCHFVTERDCSKKCVKETF